MSDKGRLYIVATPIGNLKDFTFRAIDTLKEVDFVFAEDTRNSIQLMKHYKIETKIDSYHEHNNVKKIPKIINLLNEGKNIALISDAGTPTISDPGYKLIRACIDEEINIIPIPGASAVTAALSASGLPSDSFFFLGFLPHKKGRKKKISFLKSLDNTIIIFESPHRLLKTLKELHDELGERPVVVARELTKLYEEIIRGNFDSIIEYFESKKVKGEIVIIIGRNDDRIYF
ncbi:MAG: 16S rRNA (cytidine(1402)-2'-O)-methyltransferase [Candidatus Neomarinimicrobiota bacterium]|jgi:16S rRNA (cytidine1402-2'-O)-methyltransferase|nr:16S rRNA (cytidine(1402)-2'-O)-methyltransferase [Candidatus Neomarinimicrobiota bacterium]GIS42583.1 MAG: ribosomal RNA small subunit methyltransferase I [Candidatus Neomarinimicrobiota bacterium]|tara:strand:- start:717 stop:1409 length:693 start_codon:yes stop_codon:yes gene_type:complete